jgi:hypothetical protein
LTNFCDSWKNRPLIFLFSLVSGLQGVRAGLRSAVGGVVHCGTAKRGGVTARGISLVLNQPIRYCEQIVRFADALSIEREAKG